MPRSHCFRSTGAIVATILVALVAGLAASCTKRVQAPTNTKVSLERLPVVAFRNDAAPADDCVIIEFAPRKAAKPTGANGDATKSLEALANSADQLTEITLDGKILGLDDLQAHLRTVASARSDRKKASGSKIQVVIRCDRDADFKHVPSVISMCGKPEIGAGQVSLAVAQRQSDGALTEGVIPVSVSIFGQVKAPRLIAVMLREEEGQCTCVIDRQRAGVLPQDAADVGATLKGLEQVTKAHVTINVRPRVSAAAVVSLIEQCKQAGVSGTTFEMLPFAPGRGPNANK